MACERAEIILCVTHTPNQLIKKKRFINIHTLLQTRPSSKLANVRGSPDLKSPGTRCPRDLELNHSWKRSPMNILKTCCKQHFCWQHQEGCQPLSTKIGLGLWHHYKGLIGMTLLKQESGYLDLRRISSSASYSLTYN